MTDDVGVTYLHERSTALNRQGRLGFSAQQLDKKFHN